MNHFNLVTTLLFNNINLKIMPNHVENILSFEGNEKDIKELMQCLVIDGSPSVDGFLPMPLELKGTKSPSRAKDQVLIDKYGHDNWYDWALENWGTKWGFYDGGVINDDSVYFMTAWATPYKAIQKLSEKFPSVTIKVQYADEDFGHNVGEYTFLNGIEIEINIPDGGSYDALKLALDIRGEHDYYFYDIFFDLDEEELENIKENKFIYSLVILTLEQNHFDEGLPKKVKEVMLEIAVENEQYRLAQRIKDSL